MSEEINNIIYFDPNDIESVDNSFWNGHGDSNNLMQTPEDLSVMVDLLVNIKDRASITTTTKESNNVTYNLIGKSTQVNFIGGTEIGGSEVLTDFFTNLTSYEEKVTSIDEAMCVTSIDIDFSSWYAASVIINFTDIRGAGLFNEAEYAKENETNNHSLFRSFFSFPAPIYTLIVKGYYGGVVKYPLHCSDTKYVFNATTGCFDITVHFIGYTYAMLNDVQMSYLLASNVNANTIGSNYWEQEIKSGRFSSDEGTPLPKMIDMFNKIKSSQTISEKKNSEEAKKLDIKTSETIKINNISEQLNGYFSYITTNKLGSRDKNKITVNDKFSETDEKISLLQKNITNSINKLEESQIKNKLIGQNLNPIEGVIDFTNIFSDIESEKTNLNTQKNDLEKQMNTNNISTEMAVYGMKPSLSNFMKMLIAHMETFYFCIYDCGEKIKNGKRKLSEISGIKNEDIDLNLLDGDFLPPFPGLNDGEKEIWIGEKYNYLDEVELVRNFINGRTDIMNSINQYNTYKGENIDGNTKIYNDNSDGNVTIGDVWFPINAFDNSIGGIGDKTISPYGDLSSVGDDLKQTLYDRFYLRSFIISNLTANNPNKNNGLLINYGFSEAYNFLEKSNSKITGLALDNLNELTSKTYSYGKFNDGFSYKYPSTGRYIVPLFEAFTVNRKTNFSNKIDGYDKYFANNATEHAEDFKKHYINLLDDNDDKWNVKSSTFKVIHGNKNTKKIYEEYYNVLLKKISEKDQSRAKGGNGLEDILKNYIFVDEKNQSISPKYYPNNKTNSINNRIVNGKIPQKHITGGAYEKISTELKINKNTLYNNTTLVGDFWKLYYGSDKNVKSNKDVLTSYLFDNKIDNLSYPSVYGASKITNYNDYKVFSIFGDVLYYEIDKSIDIKESKIDKNDIINRRKAYYFLQTLDLDIDFNDIFGGEIEKGNYKNLKSFVKRLPKSVVLYIGSVLYNYKSGLRDGVSKYYKIPKPWEIFRTGKYAVNNNVLTLIEKKDSLEYNVSKLFCLDSNGEYKTIFTQKEFDDLVKIFIDWCDSQNSEWYRIKNSFELFKNFSIDEIIVFLNELHDFTDLLEADKYIKSNNNIDRNILNNFSLINGSISRPTDVKSLFLLNNDDCDGVKAILNLMLSESVLFYAGNVTNDILSNNTNEDSTKKTLVNIKNSIINFKNTTNKNTNNAQTKTDINTIGNIDNEDLNLATYNYLKLLYDKWVCGFKLIKDGDYGANTNDTFQWITNNKKVNGQWIKGGEKDPYYIKNFKFVNKAYKDIGSDIRVDFKKLFDIISGNIKEKTLYSTIGDVMSMNQMLFIPLPSYQTWGTVDEFKEVFKPKSITDSDVISEFSKNSSDSCLYICMYAGKPSSSLNLGGNSSMKDSGYHINPNRGNLPKAHTNIGTNENAIGGDIMKKIPAFGVTFAKQNQQYFKNVSLNSSNPNTTDASIGALQNIVENANKKSSIGSIGQDLYNLYSSYSFSCDVEMMGCPQIQPMMYFQLNGIPMWGGAYLIFKIKHNIRPGKMITNFTGMRMSAIDPKLIETPFLSFDNMIGGGNNLGLNSLTNGDDSLDWKKKSQITQEDKFKGSDNFFILNYFSIGYTDDNKPIKKSIYNRLSYLSQFIELINNSWLVSNPNDKIIISSSYRPTAKNPKSAHKLGLACDLQIQGKTNNEALNRKLYEHIKTLMKEGMRVDQLILEDKKSNKTDWVIHVGVGHGNGAPILVNGVLESLGQYFEAKGESDIKISGTDGVIQEAKYPQKITTDFKQNTSQEKIQNEIDVKNYLKNKNLTQIQVAAIMGNIQQESTFNLLVPNGSASIGLIHWSTGKYGYADTIDGVINKIGTTVTSQLDFLTNGSTYKYQDWVAIKYSDVVSATKGFCNMVERASVPMMEKRIENANKYFQRFKNSGDVLHW